MESVNAFWYMSNNFGDNMNYYLIKALSGKEPIMSDRTNPHFIVCGSILAEARNTSTVWGAGFGSETDILGDDVNPEIISVRGHLTQKSLDYNGKQYGSVVGDPALLMPMFYKPKIERKYKVGVIPHWSEGFEKDIREGELFINPLKPVTEVIDDILSCEGIGSSSLHGLILADAYGVPNICLGQGFKFKDYYSTTDKPKDCNDAKPFVSHYRYDLNTLLNSCPFKR